MVGKQNCATAGSAVSARGDGGQEGRGEKGVRTSPLQERAAAKESMTSKGRARVPGARIQTKPPSPCVKTVLWIAAPDAPPPAASVLPTTSAAAVGSRMSSGWAGGLGP